MVSNTALAWLGNEDDRPRTNFCMLRHPGMESETGRAHVARRTLRATVFSCYIGYIYIYIYICIEFDFEFLCLQIYYFIHS